MGAGYWDQIAKGFASQARGLVALRMRAPALQGGGGVPGIRAPMSQVPSLSIPTGLREMQRPGPAD